MSFYCKFCGEEFSDLSRLLNSYCNRHPNGGGNYHQAYEGSNTNPFYCKYCGETFSDLSRLLNSYCNRHPNGGGNFHEPF